MADVTRAAARGRGVEAHGRTGWPVGTGGEKPTGGASPCETQVRARAATGALPACCPPRPCARFARRRSAPLRHLRAGQGGLEFDCNGGQPRDRAPGCWRMGHELAGPRAVAGRACADMASARCSRCGPSLRYGGCHGGEQASKGWRVRGGGARVGVRCPLAHRKRCRRSPRSRSDPRRSTLALGSRLSLPARSENVVRGARGLRGSRARLL